MLANRLKEEYATYDGSRKWGPPGSNASNDQFHQAHFESSLHKRAKCRRNHGADHYRTTTVRLAQMARAKTKKS